LNSSVYVAISLDDVLIGMIRLDSRIEGFYNEIHVLRLQAFANQIGLAIRNQRFIEKLEQHAHELEQAVTNRTHELDVERAQLQAILEAMHDGMAYSDLDFQPIYTNQALTRITGYSTDDWLSGDAQQYINLNDPNVFKQDIIQSKNTLLQHGLWQGEMALRRKNGEQFDANLIRSIVLDPSGEAIGYVTVLRDISQEKALAEQKARFIASASHELRTPIANIKTRLYLLEKQPEKFYDHISIAREVVDWMKNLVEDMFDISRFERGVLELTPEPIEMVSYLHQLVRIQKPFAEDAQINLHFIAPNTELIANIDPSRFKQVINNLINNAVHYTNIGGEVTLTIKRDDNAKHIIIQVQDTGEGISEEHLPYLFQPFYRGDKHNDKKGAGLGLSITKEIVTLHNGTIDVESVLGDGSTFIITLPLESN